jgi:hypothetical protein
VEGFEALGPETLRAALALELDRLVCCLSDLAGPDPGAVLRDASWTLTVCLGAGGSVARSCVGTDRAMATSCVRELLERLAGLTLAAGTPPGAVRLGLHGFLP